jgi:hypothetical protein
MILHPNTHGSLGVKKCVKKISSPPSWSKFALHYWKWPMQEKIASWSLVVTKNRDQESYPSQLLVTSVKTPTCHPWHVFGMCLRVLADSTGYCGEYAQLDICRICSLHSSVHSLFFVPISVNHADNLLHMLNNFILSMWFFNLWKLNCHKTHFIPPLLMFVRKFPSCKKILREVIFLWKWICPTLKGTKGVVGKLHLGPWWEGFKKIQEFGRFKSIVHVNLQVNVEMIPFREGMILVGYGI